MLFTRPLFGMSWVCPGCQGVVNSAGISEIFHIEQKVVVLWVNISWGFFHCQKLVKWAPYPECLAEQSSILNAFIPSQAQNLVEGVLFPPFYSHYKRCILNEWWSKVPSIPSLRRDLLGWGFFENSSVKCKCTWTWKGPSREGFSWYRTFRLKDLIEKPS